MTLTPRWLSIVPRFMFLRPVVSEKVTVYKHIDTPTELFVFKKQRRFYQVKSFPNFLRLLSCLYFLKIMSQQKHSARHPSIKRIFEEDLS